MEVSGRLALLSEVAFLVLVAFICFPLGRDTLVVLSSPQVNAAVLQTAPMENPPAVPTLRSEKSAVMPKTFWDWQRCTQTGNPSASLPPGPHQAPTDHTSMELVAAMDRC